jgi:glutamate dehydrogenase (NAD(P)+)
LITHIIEYNCAISKADGFDVEDVKQYMKDHKGSLIGYPHADVEETADPLSFMEHEVDYLIPAAVELSINKNNAHRIKCKAVFEGANGPTSFAAEEILLNKGIVISPDLLTNGGGVTCSYFEWLKNLDHVSPGKMTKKFEEQSMLKLIGLMGLDTTNYNVKGATELDIVYTALDEIMTGAVQENWNYAVDNDLNFRDACLVNAISKILKTYMEVGITL